MWEEDEQEEAKERAASSKKKAASKKKSSSKKTAAKKQYENPTVPDTEDVSVKMHYVDIPSNGLLDYPETVQYRDMFMRDEKILGSAQDDNYFKTLNTVLKSIMGNPDFFEELAVHDRDYLLVWIWANNYNTIKPMSVVCPSCEHQDDINVDLTKLDVTDIDPRVSKVHPFRIPLDCGKSIWVNIRRVKDEIELERYIKKHGDATGDVISAFYASTLDIEGMEDASLEDKVKWAEDNIKVKEAAHIRNFHETFDFGMSDQIEHTCTSCGEEFVRTIPFRLADFLQPTVSGDFEDLLQLNEDDGNQSD